VQALPKLAQGNAQVAILGTGKAKYEQMVKAMGTKNPKFKGVVKFSAPLAHMITAGADFILVPSRWVQPCLCGRQACAGTMRNACWLYSVVCQFEQDCWAQSKPAVTCAGVTDVW
jgi:hypothetical protein